MACSFDSVAKKVLGSTNPCSLTKTEKYLAGDAQFGHICAQSMLGRVDRFPWNAFVQLLPNHDALLGPEMAVV